MDQAPLSQVRSAVYRPVRGQNVLEETVSRLVQTLRLGVVAPGESLPSERELATLFAVSRDTVREAIAELAVAGFLQRRRGRYGGTFVTDPLPRSSVPEAVSATELADVLELRRVLECGAARAAAERSLTAGQRAELRSLCDSLAAADETQYRRLDSRLHLTIAELSGINSLVELIAENRARVNTWLDTFPLLPRNIEHSNDQHERIVSAILAGRPEETEGAVREHLSGSAALLRGFLA